MRQASLLLALPGLLGSGPGCRRAESSEDVRLAFHHDSRLLRVLGLGEMAAAEPPETVHAYDLS